MKLMTLTALTLATLTYGSLTLARSAPSLNGTPQTDTAHERLMEVGVGGEIAIVDEEASVESLRQAEDDAARLQEQITDMEVQTKTLAKSAERAKQEADIAVKRTQLREKQKVEMQKRIALAELQNKKAEMSRKQARESLQRAELRLKSLSEQNRKLQEGNLQLAKEEISLQREIRKSEARLDGQKRNMEKLKQRRMQLAQSSQRMKKQWGQLQRRDPQNPDAIPGTRLN